MAARRFFQQLSLDAPAADVQYRQTLVMGLLPIGLAVFLVALSLPLLPPPGIWIGLAGTIVLMGAFMLLRKWAERREWAGFSIIHFLVRYALAVISVYLIWSILPAALHETSGAMPFILLLLLLLLYPLGRILHELALSGTAASRGLEMVYILCRYLSGLLLLFAVLGLLSGSILEAHKDYPTDPTLLLLLLWVVGFVCVLWMAVLICVQWARLFPDMKILEPHALDDPAPADDHPTPPAHRTIHFDSEKF